MRKKLGETGLLETLGSGFTDKSPARGTAESAFYFSANIGQQVEDTCVSSQGSCFPKLLKIETL